MTKITADYTFQKYTWPDGSFTIKENLTSFIEQYKKKPEECQKITAKHALNVQANASRDAPVETGNLKNSIEAVESDDPNTWLVQDGTDYGVFTELGTSKIPAQHFLGGAAERESEPYFEDLVKELSG